MRPRRSENDNDRLKGSNPEWATVHKIELELREATERGERPLSYAEIERRLEVKKPRREATEAAVAELKRLHLVVEGPKGIMWVSTESDKAWDAPTETLG